MRVNRFALAISLCAGLAMFAGRAHAGIGGATSTLIDGEFGIISEHRAEHAEPSCVVAADGSDFFVEGLGHRHGRRRRRGGQLQHPPAHQRQPEDRLAEGQAGHLLGARDLVRRRRGRPGARREVQRLRLGQHQEVERLDHRQLQERRRVRGLGAAQATSLQAAFASSKTVKVKLNSSKGKGSISIKCKGWLD